MKEQLEVRIEKVDKYIVEFDTDVITEEWMAEFRTFMYDFGFLEEHAEHIAQHKTRFSSNFIEGYGIPLVNGRPPIGAKPEQVNKAINIIYDQYDDEVYIETNYL